MILKIALAQPMFNNYKHDPQTVKDEPQTQKRKMTSFASVLENEIYAHSINLSTRHREN